MSGGLGIEHRPVLLFWHPVVGGWRGGIGLSAGEANAALPGGGGLLGKGGELPAQAVGLGLSLSKGDEKAPAAFWRTAGCC